MTNPFRVNVLGVGISVLDLETAAAHVFGAVEQQRKGYVCITGVHGVSEAQTDPGFRDILNGSLLTTPDGMPMVWAGWKEGHREMDRVYGPDLMLLIFEKSAAKGTTHFFYGGRDGVAEMLKARLEAKFPGVKIVGTYTPPFRDLTAEELAALQDEIKTARPDIIWVGLSTPKQERFMTKYLPLLDTTVMIGVGAAFDFHAGLVPQAPRWMQRSGLEWFYRLVKEPKRLWKRYLVNNPLFIFRILSQWSGLRAYPAPETGEAQQVSPPATPSR